MAINDQKNALSNSPIIQSDFFKMFLLSMQQVKLLMLFIYCHK